MDKSLQNYCVEPVTIDDMVYMTTQILDKQEQFVQDKINGYIDTGYHYTKVQNMAKIRSHGLMTGKERSEKNVTSTIGGSFFGDGIYTANNVSREAFLLLFPFCFMSIKILPVICSSYIRAQTLKTLEKLV